MGLLLNSDGTEPSIHADYTDKKADSSSTVCMKIKIVHKPKSLKSQIAELRKELKAEQDYTKELLSRCHDYPIYKIGFYLLSGAHIATVIILLLQ